MTLCSYAASVVLSITYGKQTATSYDDPEVQQVDKCLFKLGKTISARPLLVESFPFFRYIPGYLGEYQAAHKEELSLFTQQVDGVRDNMVRVYPRQASPCQFLVYLERG
jgi:hypothetical protein